MKGTCMQSMKALTNPLSFCAYFFKVKYCQILQLFQDFIGRYATLKCVFNINPCLLKFQYQNRLQKMMN